MNFFRLIYTAVIIPAICFSACNADISSKLAEAESIIYTNPDSALNIIENIRCNTNGTLSISNQASVALIKGMLSEIEESSEITISDLQPAIEYFIIKGKGSAEEQLRTFYCQGKLFIKNNDRNNALNSFLKATEIADKSHDSITLAKTFIALGNLYGDFSDYTRKTEAFIKAADIYDKSGNRGMSFDCMLNAFNGSILSNDKFLADSLKNILSRFNGLSQNRFNSLQNQILLYAAEFRPADEIKTAIQLSLQNENKNSDEIITLALAYDAIGENAKAHQLLDFVNNCDEPYDTLKYQSILVKNYYNLGDYKSALDCYVDFTEKMDALNAEKFEQHLRAIDDKHKLEIKASNNDKKRVKTTIWCLCGCVILILVVAVLLLMFRSFKTGKDLAEAKVKNAELDNLKLKSEQEKLSLENKTLQLEKAKKALETENLEQKIKLLEEESVTLKNIIEEQNEMPVEVQKAIKTRIEMLNSLLAAYISGENPFDHSYSDWVKEYTENIEAFMDSNRLAFKASHPRFIRYFEEHGLTVNEINYVCLYAIGLRGKDVGNYIKKRSHVNISSAIRKKLGIDKHETNIGIYARRLLKEL